MKTLFRCLVILASFSLVSCVSYFKRKECESTNWFAYGENLAMQGKRTTGDQFLLECKRAEANIAEAALDQGFKKGMATYCTADIAFQTGKKGDFFSEELCDGPGIREMKRRHSEGVKEYCQVTNGQRAGGSGKKYNGICPKDLEPKFLVEYNKGRKQYLQGIVQAKNMEIQNLNSSISSNENRRRDLGYQLSLARPAQRVERTVVVDPVTRLQRVDERMVEDQSARQHRDYLEGQARQLDSSLREDRAKQDRLQKELSEAVTEMATLN